MSMVLFANSSPEWLVLLVLVSCILPLFVLPLTFIGMCGAKLRHRSRVMKRFLYLLLPWLPFAALAGLFIMSLSNLLLGSLITSLFIGVRLYFIRAQSSTNGLQAAMS